ncbi:hypothetical protein GCM10010295_61020 [Streptomyces intermedius]
MAALPLPSILSAADSVRRGMADSCILRPGAEVRVWLVCWRLADQVRGKAIRRVVSRQGDSRIATVRVVRVPVPDHPVPVLLPGGRSGSGRGVE